MDTKNQKFDQIKPKRPSVFLSYKRESSGTVDQIEEILTKALDVCRDTNDLKHKDSVTKFMDKIRDHDFAVFVISKKYLQSLCCMYEVLQFMQERNWKKRAQFVVSDDVKDSIYDKEKHLAFIDFWQKKCEELSKKVKKYDLFAVKEPAKQLNLAKKIELNIGEFLEVIADSNDKTNTGDYSALLKYITQTDKYQTFAERDLAHKRRSALLYKLIPAATGLLCVCTAGLIAYNASSHDVTIEDYALYETDICTFRYEGQARWQQPHGEGTLTILWNNGEESSYTGTFADGYPSGSGTYVWYNGSLHESDDWSWHTETESLNYTGMFCDGKVYGFGMSSGGLAFGEWHDGRLYGNNMAPNGLTYGEWRDGKLYGNGTAEVTDYVSITGHYVWQDLKKIDENGIFSYEGYWVDDKVGVFGSIHYSDSDIAAYCGYLKDGKPYYWGNYIWDIRDASGYMQNCKYSGLLDINGYPSGSGTFTYSDGTEITSDDWSYDAEEDTLASADYSTVWEIPLDAHYVGMLNHNTPQGYGKERLYWVPYSTKEIEPVYRGEYREGSPNGIGEIQYSDACMYSGEVKNGSPNGEGIYTYANGRIISGLWESDYWGCNIYDSPFNGFNQQYHEAALSTYQGEYLDGNSCGYGVYHFMLNPSKDLSILESEVWEDIYHEMWMDILWEVWSAVLNEPPIESYDWTHITFTDESAGIYDGMAFDNQPNGYGTYSSVEYTYEGSWKNGERHGLGTITYSDGTKHITHWNNGDLVKEYLPTPSD